MLFRSGKHPRSLFFGLFHCAEGGMGEDLAQAKALQSGKFGEGGGLLSLGSKSFQREQYNKTYIGTGTDVVI